MGVINIGVFGRRNVGKSSILNAVSGQDIAIVSDTPGTTADPVRKRIEIHGLGVSQLIDTAGIDDEGELGRRRVEKSLDAVSLVDVALLVFSGNAFGDKEEELMSRFAEKSVPVILLHNQSDREPLDPKLSETLSERYGDAPLDFCADPAHPAERKDSVDRLVRRLVETVSLSRFREREMFEGIVEEGSTVLLVCPVDSGAPTGRLILPQVQAIRNLLDLHAVVHVLQPTELPRYFSENKELPDLTVVDSQIFGKVSQLVPETAELTSFSMLLARSKGCFEYYLKGTPQIDALQDGDRVLILESCTHHASCEDIGRVKLPALFRKYTGRQLEFDVVAGLDRIARPVQEYALAAQCGGCVITGRQLYSRLLPVIEAGVPVTNYGMAISFMNHLYGRAVRPLMK